MVSLYWAIKIAYLTENIVFYNFFLSWTFISFYFWLQDHGSEGQGPSYGSLAQMHSVSSRSRYAHHGTALRVWLCIMRDGRCGGWERGKQGEREGWQQSMGRGGREVPLCHMACQPPFLSLTALPSSLPPSHPLSFNEKEGSVMDSEEQARVFIIQVSTHYSHTFADCPLLLDHLKGSNPSVSHDICMIKVYVR